MNKENLDAIELYNKIIEARRKIKLEKNPNNNNIKIYINKKYLGEFTEDDLLSKGVFK